MNVLTIQLNKDVESILQLHSTVLLKVNVHIATIKVM